MRHAFILLPLMFALLPAALGGLACLSNPCLHGICLDDLSSTYFCYCIDGYTGIQCQTNWDECWSSPCLNNATCVDGIAAFNCTCPAGFEGARCETDVDECASSPCLNNGTCLDAPNSYVCRCPAGYLGAHCETDAAVCDAGNETRCANGGECVEGPGARFSCACRAGFEGALCEEEVDECRSSPCRNGAVCVDALAAFACLCPFGFTGRLCEERVEICAANPCRNGALCLLEDRQPTCYCVPDYHGELCQFQYDECQLGPKCLNGGTCVDGVDNATCACPPRLTGKRCECRLRDGKEPDCNYIAPLETTTRFALFTSSTEAITEASVSTDISTTSSIEPDFSGRTMAETTPLMTTSSESSTFFDTTTEMTITSTETVSSVFSTESSTTEEMSTTYSSTLGQVPSLRTDWSTTTTPVSTTNEEISKTTMFSTFFPSSTDSITESEVFSTSTTETGEETTTLYEPNCTVNECVNGGTCVYAPKKGYQCVCPFDAEGVRCEFLLGIKKAAFTGGSYLKHRLPDPHNISFEFDAKTLSSEGLIFYTSYDKFYMFLFIHEGHLHFQFSCGYQTILLSELTVPINSGDPIHVQTSVILDETANKCDASITINQTLSMTGDQLLKTNRIVNPPLWLYLGGIPFDSFLPNLPPTGFTGCISNLKVSGRKTDIFKGAEDGLQVLECHSLACLANPCANAGTCHSLGPNTWACSCRNGYLGPTCARSTCETNPCLHGGTCLPFTASGYLCLCPFGKHGHFCEHELAVSEPFFAGTIRGLASYAAYPLPAAIAAAMELKFSFIPTSFEQISLLLFIGQGRHHDFYSDHLAVTFVKGYLMLTWNLGAGPRRIFTSQRLPEGASEYAVQLGRRGRRAWLSAGAENITGRAPGNLVHLDVAPVLYLGGHSSRNFSLLPHDLPQHAGFSGCIFGVELVSGKLVIPLQAGKQVEGRAVGQCGVGECLSRVCQNGGVCLHHASTFMCLCPDDWFGPLCSSRRNPCDEGAHSCQGGATCVALLFSYECDCPLGRTGRYCEEELGITDVSFSGRRSFLKLGGAGLATNDFNFEFEARTLGNDGIILFMGENEGGFVCLSIQGGFLELVIGENKTPKLPTLIKSQMMFVKGIWYQIDFGIFGRRAYLSVDKIISSGVLGLEYGVALDNSAIYLGGFADLSVLPLDATSKFPAFFKGCLRDLKINGEQFPLTEKNILLGRNLGDCDGTPCGKDACLNGGTCWLDEGLKPRCSCVEPFYGNQCEILAECNEKMCRNKGKCINSKCICQIGWNGAYCETEIFVTTPELRNGGYLVVRKLNEKKRDIGGVQLNNLYLNFTTIKKEGLLFWTRKGANFVGLGLDRGFMRLAYFLESKMNHGITTLPSNYRVSDGLWHTLEVSFNPFWLKIDQNAIFYKDKVRKTLKNATIISDGRFYIGGLPPNVSIWKETNATFSQGFEGCIESFGTNNEQLIRDFSRFEGQNVDVCRVY